jgi:hypothetical protein
MTQSISNSNSRGLFYALTAAMWIALPFTAYRYWSVWDRLPAHMATHFAADGRPNGWMTPGQSFGFSLVMLAIVLAVFTAIVVYAVRRRQHLDASSWAILGFFCVIVGVITYISDAVLQYNVAGAAIPLGAILAVLTGAGLLFLVIFLRAKRGSTLPTSAVISEERHASPTMALICAVPAAVTGVFAANVPVVGVRLALWASALVIAGCAAMAWDGFHYFFSPAGLEVRTLGFRLRSIPTNEIESYAVDNWRALGGYGIRGVGNTRAYVWSKTGVRIKTTEGEVFLGHTEPGRLIRDLDLITNHKAHEGARSS